MSTTASAVLAENTGATGPWVYYPGGITALTVVANFGAGSVSVDMLGPDGTTAILGVYPAVTSNSVNRSGNLVYFPPGQYRANVAVGATSVWARLDRVPT